MRTNPERLAWRILLASFFVFLLLCGSTLYVIDWFIFRSTVELDVDLTVARGTVSIVLPNTGEPIAVTDRRGGLTANTVIQTDPTSQATLTFSDPRTGEPIASLALFRDSKLTISQARAPRFGLNQRPYRIVIENLSGRSELLIFSSDRPAECHILTPQTHITISEGGQYLLDSAGQAMRIIIESGQALITDLLTNQSTTLTDDQCISVESASGSMTPCNAGISLLGDTDVTRDYTNGWVLTNDQEPYGLVQNASFDGRPVLVIDRSQGHWAGLTLGHGETRLTQTLDVEVSTYSYLELRATFYVDEQSLSTCGIAGSECPMMLRLVYLDPQGQEQVFIHGFYATHDPSTSYPMACATCRTEHERINLRSWYTYESGNLMTLLPPEQRPTRIREISFYASGHAYKVFVSGIDLIASE
jgi:hypothetical protein